jgi:hypothetical protein
MREDGICTAGSHHFAGHVASRLADENAGAHERVGRNGLQEHDFGFEVDFAHGHSLDVAQPRFRLEQLREVPEEVDRQRGPCKVSHQDDRPVVKDLEGGDSTRQEPNQHAHGVSSEQLSAEEDDEKDCNREEKPRNQLGQHGPLASYCRRNSSCDRHNKNNSQTHPPTSQKGEKGQAAEGQVRLDHRHLFLVFFYVLHGVDFLTNLEVLDFVDDVIAQRRSVVSQKPKCKGCGT